MKSVRLEECKIGRVYDWKSVGLEALILDIEIETICQIKEFELDKWLFNVFSKWKFQEKVTISKSV